MLSARIRALTLALVCIVIAGAALRLTGINWDAGAHLHPDERHLTMVGDQLRWPRSVAGYFDVDRSPLSPYNTDAGQRYLYGQFPLFAAKAVASVLGRDSYDQLNLVGRAISALVDSASIALVFLIASLLLSTRGQRAAMLGGLLAAALYASTVLAIQFSHFFTVEAWLVLTTLLAFYLAALLARRPLEQGVTRQTLGLLTFAGGALGLAAASKLSGALVALPLALALLLRPGPAVAPAQRAVATVASGLFAALVAYVTFRLSSPYAFEHSSWLDLTPKDELRAALEQQRQAVDGEALSPPSFQWLLSTPLWSPLRNLGLWGLGIPLGLAAAAGLAWMALDAARRLRRGPVVELMLLSFVGLVCLYFGSRFGHTLRYLVPVLGLLCVAASFGIVALAQHSRLAARIAAATVLATTVLYALAFVAVYRVPNTRVTASSWLNENVPQGSTILNEHWDDGLPIGGGERYRLLELPVFGPDDTTKLRVLHDGLAQADVYVLSSPRAWNTIGRLPARFPIMGRFYVALRRGELGFEKAAQFTSFPRLLGVELDDLDAEEAFWVYDHPPVIVYRATEHLDWRRFREAMCSARPLPGCSAAVHG